eukprot:413824-Prymnesium_polylepis.1
MEAAAPGPSVAWAAEPVPTRQAAPQKARPPSARQWMLVYGIVGSFFADSVYLGMVASFLPGW